MLIDHSVFDQSVFLFLLFVCFFFVFFSEVTLIVIMSVIDQRYLYAFHVHNQYQMGIGMVMCMCFKYEINQIISQQNVLIFGQKLVQ